MRNSITRIDVFKERVGKLEGIFYSLRDPYKVAFLAILRHAVQQAKNLNKKSVRRAAQW